ncbi:50S ribosome-binding GTPase [Ceratobasidium sp. AG-Ba]|nr:50S ribosome-binding GTPase [Ceratobasidium sp. AG-Ba]QRW02474.1 50S ribosome-binding GTPase [Ceratobasidium sp. AG-Ba]
MSASVHLPATSNVANDYRSTKRSVLNPTKNQLINIILLGEVGGGKTTFLSLFINLLQGNGPEELADRYNPEKESTATAGQSRTSGTTLYSVQCLNGARFRILDTPGLADVRGLGKDTEYIKDINDTIRSHDLTEIHAVLVVTNSAAERPVAMADYIFKTIAAMLPIPILTNLGFVLTNYDAITQKFKLEMLQEELRNSKWWPLQNALHLFKEYKSLLGSGKASDYELKERLKDIEYQYGQSIKYLNDLTQWLDELHPKETKAIDRLCQIPTEIGHKVNQVVAWKLSFDKETESLKEVQKDLEDAMKDKSEYEKQRDKETEIKWGELSTDLPNVVCKAEGCRSNCHKSCAMSKSRGSREIATHKAEDHDRVEWIFTKHEGKANPQTLKKLEERAAEVDRLEKTAKGHEANLSNFSKESNGTQSKIQTLVRDFNRSSIVKDFTSLTKSAIALLKLRKKTEPEARQKEIDEMVEILQKKLDVIAGKYKLSNGVPQLPLADT